jgi:RNA polymerase sigma-70 factor (ECF subfamily)
LTLSVSDVMTEPAEQELVQELEAIFRAHYRMTYRTAYGVTGSSEDAEDVVQTIFLRLVRREFPPDLKKNPGAYLYRAAVNLALNTIRSKKRRILTGVPAPPETGPDVADSDPAEESHRQLYEAVAELTPESAQILILRYVHDYSDAEIAKLLGTSRGTIAVSLYRSRSRLRKLMRVPSGGKS